MYVRTRKQHNSFTMARFYLIIALVIQGSFTYANVTNSGELADSISEIESNNTETVLYEVDEDLPTDKNDGVDFFLLADTYVYPTSSVAMMTQVTNSEKPVEEQVKEIKEIAQKITAALKNEMTNLLAFALGSCDKEEEEDNHLRKRRSAETPMASTKMVTRLLKHIKANNEVQNIAIDKMMTAQEIADKYGIEFSPDTEILSDLALAANQQAKEMNSLLQESLETKNVSQKVEYVPVDAPSKKEAQESEGYYVYSVQYPEPQNKPMTPNAQPEVNHHHHAESYPSYNYYYPYETQISAPVQNYYSPPVSKRPNFYETMSYAPEYPYCSMEPLTSASTIVMPYEEIVEPEPELVGEEFEETITSKVNVDHGEEPGSATVNHVMSYTVGEKSHFRTPEIERLPQQMQYCFFLM